MTIEENTIIGAGSVVLKDTIKNSVYFGNQQNFKNMDKDRCIIIAEAGVNHNGDLNIAKKLIDEAAFAGVDMIKFQTFKASNVVSEKAKKASYQIKKDEPDSQLEMLKKLELTENDHIELIEYCQKKKITFFSTAFDLEGLHF